MKEQHQTDTTKQMPSFTWILKSPHRLFAFGLGSGLLRPAPGTWGTVLALFLWFPLVWLLQSEWLIALFLVLAFIYGVYSSQKVCQELGVNDHSGVVWDEWVAFWFVLFVTAPVASGPYWYVTCFVLFRIFDILKPWPIKFFERKFPNGFGIMIDDLIAALYVLFSIAVIVRVMGVFVV